MKIIYSFLLILLTTFSLKSQVTETFLVDSINLSVKQMLPFDRPFFLGLRGESAKNINSGFLFEWKIKDTIRTLKPYKESDFIPQNNVINLANGSNIYIPAQPPNKNFALLLAHRFDGDLLDNALQASWYLYKEDSEKATSILNDLNSKVKSKIKESPDIPSAELHKVTAFAFEWMEKNQRVKIPHTEITDVNASIRKGFINFYENHLDSEYSKLQTSILTYVPITLTSNNISEIVHALHLAKISTSEFSPLVTLLFRGMMTSLLEGTVSFQKDLTSSQVKIHDLPARLKNLNASSTEIEQLRQYCELIQAQLNNGILNQLILDLDTLHSSVKSNRDNLIKISANILDSISNNINLVYTTWVYGHNEIWDLKTKGSYYVIPEIGLVTIYAIGNELNELIVRPYVGTNIYFRPIDKSVPFKYFDKKYRYLQRISLNLGVTVGKVEQGEFSDFFNNMNLLIGGNYKLTRQFSLSAGLSFLKRRNAIHAIEDKAISLNPYLGISIDVDFAHSIPKLTGKLSL